MRFVLLVAMLVLAITAGIAGTSARAADIVGTWTLVSWTAEEIENKMAHRPLGDHPMGLLTYTADGHMTVIFVDPSRKATSNTEPTEAEASALYRTMVAYAGTYTIEGDKVTHKIDVAWNQGWNGTSQTRFIEAKDNRLTIKTAPLVSPVLGKQIVSTLVFERAK